MTNIELTDQESAFIHDYFQVELETGLLSNTTIAIMRSIIKKLVDAE